MAVELETPVGLQPCVFVNHGGGPLPYLGVVHPEKDFGMDQTGIIEDMHWLGELIAENKPQSLLIVSAHWTDESDGGVSLLSVDSTASNKDPGLLYDYYGFPAESYQIEFAASVDTELNEAIESAISKGAPSVTAVHLETKRGWDHGVFIPLKVAFEHAHTLLVNAAEDRASQVAAAAAATAAEESAATGSETAASEAGSEAVEPEEPDFELGNISIAQLSLVQSYDPSIHIEIGQSIRHLRRNDGARVMIVGSGMSFHNLRFLLGRHGAGIAGVRKQVAQANEFDGWLKETFNKAELSVKERMQRIQEWDKLAPHARFAHPPRAEEHLVPLFVCFGAGLPSDGDETCDDPESKGDVSAAVSDGVGPSEDKYEGWKCTVRDVSGFGLNCTSVSFP